MVIPIGILAGILYNMEKNVVSENTGYMEYTMERNKDAVATKINSINMSTQFFLSDEPLLEMLKRTKDGKTFRRRNGTALRTAILLSLERLVNNNPLLYGVRVCVKRPGTGDDADSLCSLPHGKAALAVGGDCYRLALRL